MLSGGSDILNHMQQQTRDNLIYSAVGLTVLAVVVADFLYADSHGQTMWWPSRFASRAVYTTLLLVCFVVRESRKVNVGATQLLTRAVFAATVNLLIVFALRHIVSELPGISFSVLAVVEMFVLFQLTMALGRYFGLR